MRRQFFNLLIFFLLLIPICRIYNPLKGPEIANAQEAYFDTNRPFHWVICIDSSKRMETPLLYNLKRIDLAKIGSNLFTKLLSPTDQISIVSYAEEAELRYSLSDPSSGNLVIKEPEIQNAIDSISLDGLAFLGNGLNEALYALEKEEKEYNERIILLSNQWSSYGVPIEDILPELINRGTRIYPLGIGGRVDHKLLMELASDTGGKYHHLPEEIFIPAFFASLWSEITGGDELARAFNTIMPYEILFEKVSVDPYCQRITFILYWLKQDLDIECILIDPNGIRISPLSGLVPSSIYPYSEITYISRGLYKIFKVKNPRPGIWQMKIIPQDGTGEIPYVFEVISENKPESPDIFSINTDKQFYCQSELISLQALLGIQELLGEVAINGIVDGPNGIHPEIVLYDDGLAEHNDEAPLDGIYSNFYNPCLFFSEDDLLYQAKTGPYVFHLSAKNKSLTANIDSNSLDLVFGYPFQRNESITIFIENCETNSVPVADAGSNREIKVDGNKKNATVQLNGLNSFDPEGKIIDFAWYAPGIIFDDPTSPTPKGVFPIGLTIVKLKVSDGENISEPSEIKITVKKEETKDDVKKGRESNNFNFGNTFNPFNRMPFQNSLFNLNYSLPVFPQSLFSPFNFQSPLSYLSFPFGGNFNSKFQFSNTKSMIMDSPYATNFVFGSGFTNAVINITVNNYNYYTYNYY